MTASLGPVEGKKALWLIYKGKKKISLINKKRKKGILRRARGVSPKQGIHISEGKRGTQSSWGKKQSAIGGIKGRRSVLKARAHFVMNWPRKRQREKIRTEMSVTQHAWELYSGGGYLQGNRRAYEVGVSVGERLIRQGKRGGSIESSISGN